MGAFLAKWRAVLTVGLCAVCLAAGYSIAAGLYSDRLDAAQAEHALEVAELRADAEEQRAAAERKARELEAQWGNEFRKASDEANERIEAARRDAASAAAVAGGLRERAAALARSCGGGGKSAAAASSGQAASSPGLVLADLFGRADQAAGELAEAYDRARAAGLACERAAEAVKGQ